MRKIYLFILVGIIFLWGSLSFADRAITIAEKETARTALVIGNSDYSKGRLRNPVHDARDIKKELSRLGFDVLYLENGDKRAIEDKVRAFRDELSKDGVALFYFAGHGLQVQGENYLIPLGADIEREVDVPYESVSANWVLGNMYRSGQGMNLVVLDACRNNPYDQGFRSPNTGLAQMRAPTGTFIGYATGPGDVAADGTGNNGVFTKHLIKEISKPELPVERVFKNTRKSVARETQGEQVPWSSSNLIGDFYFVAGGSAVVEQPAQGESTKGALKINTSPKRANISINNTPRGPAPVSLSGLSPGSYRVRAEKDGYEAQKKRVQVRAGRTATVRLYLDELIKTGRLYVHPTPEDARVRIMNIVPPYEDGIELEQGRYEIRVDKQGYETEDRVERLAAGEDLDVYVELEKKQVAQVQSGGAARAGETWTEPVTGMEFVWVPGGCYQMGSENGGDDEEPVHEVCVDGFWMGKYEVTQGQWEEIMGNNPSFFDRGDDYPVENVSWNDCQDFIEKLNRRSNHNFRLPTEAEWEYAARSGGKRIKYPWGNSLGSGNANCDDCGSRWDDERTAPVGSFDPNDLGLYDMAGNVWEWCQDVYDEDAYTRHSRHNPEITSGG